MTQADREMNVKLDDAMHGRPERRSAASSLTAEERSASEDIEPRPSPPDVVTLIDHTFELLADAAAEPVPPTPLMSLSVSIVVPVFNEQDTVVEVIRRLQVLTLNSEILVVDDHSTDHTYDRLLALAEAGEIRLFRHERNRGKGAALRTGFSHARGDVVVIQDGDLEYNPRDIPHLIRPIAEGRADVVYGSRYLSGLANDPAWWHRLGNRFLTGLSNVFTGQRLTDMETCYKVIRRNVLGRITLVQDRFGVEPELTAKLSRRKHKILELPVQYHGRGYSQGKKIGVKDAISTVYCILRYGLAD
jgi:glycosyltransferase involved in cell wall biosynthesis